MLVGGAADDVRLEVTDASLDDVLAALGVNFGLRYRSPAPLGRRITGAHRGSLQRVVALLLDGYDFVVKTGAEGVEVTVYGTGKPQDTSAPSKAVEAVMPAAPAQTSSARSRREERRKRNAN